MKKKYIVLTIILAIILVLTGLLIMRKNSKNETSRVDNVSGSKEDKDKSGSKDSSTPVKNETVTDSSEQNRESTQSSTEVAKSTDKEVQGRFSSEEDIGGGSAQVFRITFDGKSFNPSNLKLSKGDIVWFENNSTELLWITSGKLFDYPQLDSGKDIKRGERFELLFQKTGKFEFENKHDGTKGSLEVVQ